ncbi:MAG: zinc ribbon domain-containing protein [Spirochaetes bacterium]|nr:zinc ribbon domain-containing protein [Spirochaetota bacterium]
MPLYEFSCTTCGNVFTELRRMGDHAKAECPECGSVDTGRKISSFASSSSSARAGGGCAPSGG